MLKRPRAPSTAAQRERPPRTPPSTWHRPPLDGHGCNRRPSCVHGHRLNRTATTAVWTTRPRTDSMTSVKNKRAAAGTAATTLPVGITTPPLLRTLLLEPPPRAALHLQPAARGGGFQVATANSWRLLASAPSKLVSEQRMNALQNHEQR